MFVKFVPVHESFDEDVSAMDANTLVIGSDEIYFDPLGVEWPDIYKETDGAVEKARRDEAGALYLNVRRRTTALSSPEWEDGEYHEVMA